MNPLEQTQARGRVYRLFSRLYGRGLTADVRAIVESIPDLAAQLPERFDADAAAADHYALFSLDVFPYASLFLDPEARLGGATTDAVQRHYARAGFQPVLDRESADHLAHELALLAFLAEAEADAVEDEATGAAAHIRTLTRHFLDEHLLRWLPACAFAIQQQAYPLYSALSRLTLDVVLDHRAALGEASAQEKTEEEGGRLPLLEDPKTGLKDIAVYLATPAWSGLFLSRSDIARLGRGERLPRGFGSRIQTLTNLLRAAAEFDRMAPLLDALAAQVGAWEAFFEELSRSPLAPMQAAARPWLVRLRGTEAMIEQMREATRAGHIS